MKTRMSLLAVVGVLLIGQVSWGILSDVLWSENFDGFNAGPLPPQDATWSQSVGAGITNPIIDIAGGSGNPNVDWPLTDTPGLIVGGTFPSSAAGVTATKDMSITATEDVVEFEYKMYANLYSPGNYHGNHSYMAITNSAGDWIAYMEYKRYADGTIFNLSGTPFTNPAADFNTYAITMDFTAQTCSIAVNGVDQGISSAMMFAATPGDVDQIILKTGGYYSGGNDVFVQWVDDMSVSQVPEPVTMVLLGLGGVAALRRRK